MKDAGPRPISGLSPFVGREREVATLQEALGRTEAGQPQVVAIVGEAGMGKTRLLYECRRALTDRGVTWLHGRCLPRAHATSYLPVLNHLCQHCGITWWDPTRVIREKLVRALDDAGMATQESLACLLHLFGIRAGAEQLAALTAEEVKARTHDTMRELTLRASRQRTMILVVEDVHWIDTASEEYLGRLVADLGTAPVMVVSTSRPGYQPGWIHSSGVTRMALPPLSATASQQFVRSLLDGERVGLDTAGLVLERGAGHPLLLEELAMAARDQSAAPTALPGTLPGVLRARIDRLPDEPRRALQTAAVLGLEFPRPLLDAVWDGPGGVDPCLVELERQGFLRAGRDGDDPVHAFKHALTHDAAYESVLESRRRVLHGAVGRALETLAGESVEGATDHLAYHYSRAGDAAKAIDYLIRSADKAARVHANADAVRMLQEALTLVDRLPASERERVRVTIVLRRARVLHQLGRHTQDLQRLHA